MQTTQRTAALSGRRTRFGPLPSSSAGRALVIRHFRDDNKATETKLSEQQIKEVIDTPEGVISPRRAEMRADMGRAATDLHTMQAFDGPVPETLNGRLCMLSIPLALFEEWQTGNGMWEQVFAHPERIIAITLLITLATYAPIFRGYTRKEPFANNILGVSWSPMAENWNGRLAMLGFVGMIATEAVTHVNTLQAWGLQDVYFGIRSATGL